MSWAHFEKLEKFLYVIGWIYYGAFLLNPTWFHGKSLLQDPMSVSGFGLILVGVAIAWKVQSGFFERLGMMFRSGSIMMTDMGPDAFYDWVRRRAARNMLIIAGTLLPLYLGLVSAVDSNELGKPHLYFGGVIGGWLIATRFAFGVATGAAARRLSGAECRFVLAPSHPDKSSGFGHLGYYYFDQALVLLLPAAFMLFWLVYIAINLNNLKQEEVFNIVSKHAREVQVQFNIEYHDDRELPPIKPPDFVEEYVVCPEFVSPITQCASFERRYIWKDLQLSLIAFNLVIFLFVWIIPSLFLFRRMRAFRDEHVNPEVDRIERLLAEKREMAAIGDGPPDRLISPHLADLAERLSMHRACPIFPIPIWTALTAVISNVSAIFGLLGAGLL